MCLSLNRIYDVKKLAFFAPSVSSAHMSNVPPTSVCRQDKKFWLILLPGIDMAVGCLMDKQKYRLTFYWRNQEGFIRWAKSRDNIVNRDIWNKIPLSSSHLDNLPSQFSTGIYTSSFFFLMLVSKLRDTYQRITQIQKGDGSQTFQIQTQLTSQCQCTVMFTTEHLTISVPETPLWAWPGWPLLPEIDDVQPLKWGSAHTHKKFKITGN